MSTATVETRTEDVLVLKIRMETYMIVRGCVDGTRIGTYLTSPRLNLHQPLINRKGSNATGNVPTVSSEVQLGHTNRTLDESVVNIDPGPLRLRDDSNFGRRGSCATDAVQLSRICIIGSYCSQEDGCPICLILRKVMAVEVEAFGGSSSHPYCWEAVTSSIGGTICGLACGPF